MTNFFPDVAKEFYDESMEANKKEARSRLTKRRIEFREKLTIRLAKIRHVIWLHMTTRSFVIDGFESPSQVASLFHGTYLFAPVAFPSFVRYRAFAPSSSPYMDATAAKRSIFF